MTAALTHGHAGDPIPVKAINHMEIRVNDLERSVKWYRWLFGLPTVVETGHSSILRVGDGQYLTLTTLGKSRPGIVQIGFAPVKSAPATGLPIVKQHGATDARNVKGILRFKDPAGIGVQLFSYRSLNATEVSPIKGLLPVREFNHFTVFVPDAKRNVQFYQQLFGLRIDTYQGPMPIIRVGEGNQFLAFVGGRSDAFAHHACFTTENFDPDKIQKKLLEYGLKPRGKKRGPAGPLEYYVTMRMPNRGGAPKGTPELYLTDPDGILLQLQDVRYAGGGGYLGDKRGIKKR